MLKGRSLSSQKVCRDRTPKAWQSGKRRPSKVNLERIGTAYRTVRRQNVAAPLLRRLNAGGGTRVEIHPLNQSQVARPLQRLVEYRTMHIRHWDRVVGTWATGDHQGLDDAWTTGVLPDLGPSGASTSTSPTSASPPDPPSPRLPARPGACGPGQRCAYEAADLQNGVPSFQAAVEGCGGRGLS